MKSFRRILAILFLALPSLVFAAAEAPFSTNDLSILLPLAAATHQPKYAIHPGDPAWRILSLENFNLVLAQGEAERVFLTPKFRDPANWYLVGIRYAPCTFFAGAPQECKEQIRFVFQPYGAAEDHEGFSDYAMHVVFNFNVGEKAEKSERLEGFRAVKDQFTKSTLDKPLGPHPVLLTAAGDKYLGALRKEVIEKFINPRAPSLITMLGLGFVSPTSTEQDSDHWIFFQGAVGSSGLWRPIPLSVGAPLMSEHMVVDQENFTLNTNIVLADNRLNMLAEQKDPVDVAFQIFDQKKNNDHTVSCTSCHIADRTAFPPLFDADDKAGKKNFLAQFSNVWKNKTRVTEFLAANEVRAGKHAVEVPPVRIFGYLYADAYVSQRVISDSAMAVEQANALLGLRPAPLCTSPAKRLKLLSCLYMGKPDANFEACMASSCR